MLMLLGCGGREGDIGVLRYTGNSVSVAGASGKMDALVVCFGIWHK